jgi:RNA-splicing ligase RtcB
MFQINGKYTSAKVMIDYLDNETISQITQFVNHPAFTNPIAIMPDAHKGKGSCIGLSMELTDKVIPATVGVDISCGMLSINIGKSLPMSLMDLDCKIRQKVPFGFDTNEKSLINMEKDFPWRDVNTLAHNFSLAYNEKFGTNFYPKQKFDYRWFEKKIIDIKANLGRVIKSLGSLGSGNHFCELGLSTDGDYWVTIHTGSRNLGKCICEYWQNVPSANSRKEKQEQFKNRIDEIRKQYKGMEIKAKIKEARTELGLDDNFASELDYLEGEFAMGYLYDMIFAQKYAEVNRSLIAKSILNILKIDEIDRIETVHNFVDFRDFIVRKGSVRSYIGERFILPFNMRDGILICEGKSNPEFNFSAPHGAGRLMSRAQAKKNINLENFTKQMEGIYSTSVNSSTLDEAPDAYKDAKVIEAAIEPTANILFRIKPILNMKDGIGSVTD